MNLWGGPFLLCGVGMGLLSWIKNLRRTTPEQTGGRYGSWPDWFRAASGVRITHDTALNYSAVWACTRVIAESIAGMSWHVYAPEGERGRRRMASHPVDWILSTQSNPEMAAGVFKETMLKWALNWGNAYAEIERDFSGRAVALWPIDPQRVSVVRTQSGELYYDITNSGQPNTVLDPSQIYHLRGLGDGIVGDSVVTHAAQTIGLGLGADEFAQTFLENGLAPTVALEHPGTLSATATENLQKSWLERFGGRKNSGKPVVLEESMKAQVLSISPEAAQLLETRKFTVTEICRWYRVPPHKVADLDRSTNNNIEHQSIEFVTDSLIPWVLRMEQEATIKLFGQNRPGLYTKMNVAALLRGDLQSRYAAYAVGRQWGWLTINDILTLEDMNPIPSLLGDARLVPSNMVMVRPNGEIIPMQQPQPEPPAPRPSQDRPQDIEDAVRVILAEQLSMRTRGTNGALHP